MNTAQWSDDAFAGYVAGMLDGEGNIEIHPDECGIRVRIANTFRPALEAIANRLPYGTIEEYARKGNLRRLYNFRVSNAHDCRELLTLTRPYLIIKAAAADAALGVIAAMQARMDALDDRNRRVLAELSKGRLQREVAVDFGISQALVSRIKSGHLRPTEIARLNARQGLKKFIRPKDQIFRLHGDPS